MSTSLHSVDVPPHQSIGVQGRPFVTGPRQIPNTYVMVLLHQLPVLVLSTPPRPCPWLQSPENLRRLYTVLRMDVIAVEQEFPVRNISYFCGPVQAPGL